MFLALDFFLPHAQLQQLFLRFLDLGLHILHRCAGRMGHEFIGVFEDQDVLVRFGKRCGSRRERSWPWRLFS